MTVDLTPLPRARPCDPRSWRPPPHTGKLDTPPPRDAGVGAVVLPSLFEEEVEAESMTFNEAARARQRGLRRGHRLLPAVDSIITAADRHLLAPRTGQGNGRRPGHRQRQRSSAGGWVRYARRTSSDAGADAHRAQHVRRRRRSDPDGGRRRGGRPRPDRRGPHRGDDPARGEAQSVLLVVCELRGGSRTGRRRRPGPVQSLLPAGPRPRDVRRHAVARAQPRLGAAVAAALDRDPATSARGRRVARRDVGRPGRE